MLNPLALGIDFGTASARAVLADVRGGGVVAVAEHPYPDGVISETLPDGEEPLPPNRALQNPADWLEATRQTVRSVLAESNTAPERVKGIGIDFTACTVLPTMADGTPLCECSSQASEPHAWPKLWKHHAAQPQADCINEQAAAHGVSWLARYGGTISSEWLLPKALQMLEEAAEIYEGADQIVEGGDWVVWQLTGARARSACMAGYKANWHKQSGYPDPNFLASVHPALRGIYEDKIEGAVVDPGACVGGLTDAWADDLGLPAGTPVGAALIDAHAAALGGGVERPQHMFMIMGTSTCHMLMAEHEELVEGIAGVVENGILPGLFGYEAGQPATGDSLEWLIEHSVPRSYHETARRQEKSVHDVLTERAQQLDPGEHGLLALDWWNGSRSPLGDSDLSGLLVGVTLQTKPEETYRALVETTAFGTRAIIEAFAEEGVAIDSISAGGSMASNPMTMQIYADVTGRTIAVADTDQASALGAAMLGAVAEGLHETLPDAVSAMAPPPARTYIPQTDRVAVYDALYEEYCRLRAHFGRGGHDVMHTLSQLRSEQADS